MVALIWAVLILFALYSLQKLVYYWAGLKAVSYHRSFSAPYLFAGQTLWMQETIANRKRLPLPWIRVESLIPAQLVFARQEAHMSINRGETLQNHASLFSLPAYTEIVRKHEVLCPHRGLYRISSSTLSFGDLVGAASRSATLQTAEEVVVFPRLFDVRDFPLSARKFLQSAQSMDSPIREDHMHVSGVRPYRSGDSFRWVNWNATAKTGELLVHKRESMTDNDLILFVNAEMLDSVHNRRISPEQFEDMLSYAASAARYLISGGGKVGLVYNGSVHEDKELLFRMSPKAGTAHFHAMLRAMALFQPVTRLNLSFALKQLVSERPSGRHYLLLTGFLGAEEEEWVRRLKAQGNAVEVMRIGREVGA